MSFLGPVSSAPQESRLPAGRSAVISVLDVGSSKICCMIAKLRPREDSSILPGRSHTIEVMGLGHQRSRGIKSGVVVDMEAAEKSLRLAVDSAERAANVTVNSLLLAVSAGRLSSQTFTSDVNLSGREATRSDVRAVLAAGFNHVREPDRSTLHALPIGYTLDSETGISDPVGMIGNQLSVDMHVVTADAAPIRNLEACINRSHLSVSGVVATPYASGLAALVEDEARMGAACIDMGGGTTTVSIFLGGNLVFADALAVGGNHVIMDRLMRSRSTSNVSSMRGRIICEACATDNCTGWLLPSSIDATDRCSVSSAWVALAVPCKTFSRSASLTRIDRHRARSMVT